MNTILLFLALTLPGKEPVTQQLPEPSLAACIADVGDFLGKVEGGHLQGEYQASCVIEIPKTIDN